MNESSWGDMTEEMRGIIEGYIREKDVWDIGAGTMERSAMLRDLGAARVIAIEPNVPDRVDVPEDVELWTKHVHAYEEEEMPDVAWYYPTPSQAASNIKNYVAFYPAVKVEG